MERHADERDGDRGVAWFTAQFCASTAANGEEVKSSSLLRAAFFVCASASPA